MTMDLAFGEDERTKKKRNEKRRKNGNEVGRDHERKKRERERFLLVALSPGCRVVLPYYYPYLMLAALYRGKE